MPSLYVHGPKLSFSKLGKFHFFPTILCHDPLNMLLATPRLKQCAGFVWGRVTFLHSSHHGTMFRNFYEKLLSSRANTAPKPFLLSLHSPVRRLRVHKRLREDRSKGRLPQFTTKISHSIQHCGPWQS